MQASGFRKHEPSIFISCLCLWLITFSTYGSACVELFQTVTSETIFKLKLYLKCKHPVFANMNLVFLLAVCAYGLVDTFPYKNMSCLWSLIWLNRVRGSWCLITWLEKIVRRSALCFWTLISSNWMFQLFLGQSLSKRFWLGNITKIPVAFTPDHILSHIFGAYTVFKINT